MMKNRSSGASCRAMPNNNGMILQSFNLEEQKNIKDYYVQLLTEVLFGAVKPKLSKKSVENVIEKLPEIIFEWQYMETFLKEKGFNFKDKLVCSYSGANGLKEFLQNVNEMTSKFA